MQTSHSSASAISRRTLLRTSLALTAAGYFGRVSFAKEARTAAKVKKELIVHSQTPLNAEPELFNLIKSPITPTEYFYVRNHGTIPTIQEADFQLSIEGMVQNPIKLSLAEIHDKFKSEQIEATLTCAGNRRFEMEAVKKVGGVQWREGAIGNATWKGPRLADILKMAGIDTSAKHVWFEGGDAVTEKDGSVAPFGGSIPLEKALEDLPGVPHSILATHMNGAPLTVEHGFPVRTVVPGFIGARSVKWLKKIVVSDRPSPNHYVADAYKLTTTSDKDVLKNATPIYSFPINGAVCLPAAKSMLKPGKTTISGYALPQGEKNGSVAKVEVSIDEGKNWTAIKFNSPCKPFTWQLWSLDVDLTPQTKSIWVRSTDSLGNVQPETTPWNIKGYMQNCWHRAAIQVQG